MTLSLIALVAPLSSCVSGKRDASGPLDGHDNVAVVTAEQAPTDTARAQFLAALRHESGNDRAVDLETAARLYRRAARAGHPAAQNNLGLMYLEGRGVERSPAQARAWLSRSAEQGFEKAEKNLAVLTMADAVRTRAERANKERANTERRPKALDVPMTLAASGADNLPERAKGSLTPAKESVDATATYYKNAAAKGSATAQHLTGLMHLEGRGAERNPSQAVEWFGKAAQQGFAQSQFMYGWLHLKGLGTRKDDAAAARWITAAAEQGVAQAQLSLGLMHIAGQGVRADDRLATRWLSRAAEQGLAPAQHNLALVHLRGRAPKSDPQLAFDLLRRAARSGHAPSMQKIGDLYQVGRGVDEDPIAAMAWYGIAAEFGDTLAIERRRQLASHMSKGQLTKAQAKLESLRTFANR